MHSAARQLRHRPGFSLAVILLIALSVGAGSAVFTMVHRLLRTPPAGLADPSTLVRLNPARRGEIGSSTYPDYAFYRDNARVFRELFAYDGSATTVQLRAGAALSDADARFVTGNFFPALGVRAANGRLLAAADDAEQAENAVVLSESLQRRLYSSPVTALGQTLMINGHAFTVVGVVAAQFRGAAHDDAAVELWLPMWKRPLVTGRPRQDLERAPNYVHAFMVTMGRLAPRASVTQAQANLSALGHTSSQQYRESAGAEVVLSKDFGLGPSRRETVVILSKLLGGIALIVLFIVCANLANLMLARALARRSEITVKLALGAGRLRLIREFALETVGLALVGGALGLLFAFWATRGLSAFLPFTLAGRLTPDLGVFAFALALALGTALICGVAPALLATRHTTFSSTAARVTGGGAAARTALVITQVALCFLLLCGATLFLRTLSRVHDVPLGFNPRGVLALSFDLRAHGYDETSAPGVYDRLTQRLGALPGVRIVTLGSIVPLSGARRISSVQIEGRPVIPGHEILRFDNDLAAPGYFRAMQTSLLRGREFSAADVASAPGVVVINDVMARTYWPGQDALGKRIGRNGQWWEVIGVVPDTRVYAVTEPAVPMFFRPFAQAFFPRMIIFVRTGSNPLSLVPSVRRAIAEVDPNIVPRSIDALDTVYANAIRSFTVNARLVAVLGALALLLATMGLYAVTAYLVAQRTKELGLRMAIGAQPRDVLRDVLGGALQRAGLGLIIGALAALSIVPALERFLFELSPLDPVTFALAAALLAGATLLASAIPARRATRLDPLVALRME